MKHIHSKAVTSTEKQSELHKTPKHMNAYISSYSWQYTLKHLPELWIWIWDAEFNTITRLLEAGTFCLCVSQLNRILTSWKITNEDCWLLCRVTPGTQRGHYELVATGLHVVVKLDLVITLSISTTKKDSRVSEKMVLKQLLTKVTQLLSSWTIRLSKNVTTIWKTQKHKFNTLNWGLNMCKWSIETCSKQLRIKSGFNLESYILALAIMFLTNESCSMTLSDVLVSFFSDRFKNCWNLPHRNLRWREYSSGTKLSQEAGL